MAIDFYFAKTLQFETFNWPLTDIVDDKSLQRLLIHWPDTIEVLDALYQ